MKRIYVCIGIVVLLLAAAFYSSFRVQQFAEDISDDIDTAMEDIRNSDLTGARQALAERRTSRSWKPPCAPPMAIWN